MRLVPACYTSGRGASNCLGPGFYCGPCSMSCGVVHVLCLVLWSVFYHLYCGPCSKSYYVVRVLCHVLCSVFCVPSSMTCTVIRVLSHIVWSSSVMCSGPYYMTCTEVRVLSHMMWSMFYFMCCGPCSMVYAMVCVLGHVLWSMFYTILFKFQIFLITFVTVFLCNGTWIQTCLLFCVYYVFVIKTTEFDEFQCAPIATPY